MTCDAASGGGECDISGRQVLSAYKHIDGPDYWDSYGRLVGIMLGFRLLVLVMYYYPLDWIVGEWLSCSRIWACCRLMLCMHVGKVKSMVSSRGNASELPARIRTEPPYFEEDEKAKMARRVRYALAALYLISLRPHYQRLRSVLGTDPMLQGSSISIGSANEQEGQLVWRNLTLSLSNGKVLIDNVDGIARGGRCLSLMGPSGAGANAAVLSAIPYSQHACLQAKPPC